MGLKLAKENLKIQHGRSACQNVTISLSADELTAKLRELMMKPAVIVIWGTQDIVWGKWDTDGIDGIRMARPDAGTDAALWQEIRVFNKDAELHLRRDGSTMSGRFVTDTDGEAIDYIDTFSRFWGERDSEENDVPAGFARLIDASRKLTLTVPYGNGSASRLGLTTRNYIGFDESTGLAGYADYRFVSIDSAEEMN